MKNKCQVAVARLDKRGVPLTGIFFDNRDKAERGKPLHDYQKYIPSNVHHSYQASDIVP